MFIFNYGPNGSGHPLLKGVTLTTPVDLAGERHHDREIFYETGSTGWKHLSVHFQIRLEGPNAPPTLLCTVAFRRTVPMAELC